MNKIKICILISLIILFFSSPCYSFTINLDIGHTPDFPGVISSRGIPELIFNRLMANAIKKELQNQGYIVTTTENISLPDRIKIINERKPDLVISIHHDSVQPKYLTYWKYENKDYLYSDKFSGFSIFVSKKNSRFSISYTFANILGKNLLENGFHPTLHHAEKIQGEGRTLLNDNLGIYRFDELIILKSNVPTVLLECAVIVNRVDELLILNDSVQKRFVKSVVDSVNTFRKNNV